MEDVQSLRNELDLMVRDAIQLRGDGHESTLDIRAKATAAKISIETALSAEESAQRLEVATKRLVAFTGWLMVVTGVLAAATIALVIVTATQ